MNRYPFRRLIPTLLPFVICASAAFLSGCATTPPTASSELTPAEFFQRAQDASENGNFQLAIDYYTLFQQKYPDDKAHQAWASYEIAFSYHKMGNNKKAIELFNQLLDVYAKGDPLPDGPRILAEKVKARIEASTTKQAPPQGS